MAEQSTQHLQILTQVDSQIAKALKDAKQSEVPKFEMKNLKIELLEKLKETELKLQQETRHELNQAREKETKELEQKL